MNCFLHKRKPTADLIVWLLVTGNIAGSFLNTDAAGKNGSAQNTFALIAIAVLAGASERLLPSLGASTEDVLKSPMTLEKVS